MQKNSFRFQRNTVPSTSFSILILYLSTSNLSLSVHLLTVLP